MKRAELNIVVALYIACMALVCLNPVRAQEQTKIFGRLLGCDGKAMPMSHVHLVRPDHSKSILSVEVNKNGTFQFSTDAAGFLFARFSGVNHRIHEVPLFIAPPAIIQLDVQLGPYEYVNDFSHLKIIGDFNNFSSQTAVPMERQSDGTYAANLDTQVREFTCQIVGATRSGEPINGTQSAAYVYDGNGSYRSRLTSSNGRIRVSFDPKKLVRGPGSAQVHFGDANRQEAKLVLIYDDMLQRRRSFSEAFAQYKRTGRPVSYFKYNWPPASAAVSKQISEEKDPRLRQVLLLSYLDLGFGVYGAVLEPVLARQALAEIAPSSTLWSLEPDLIGVALRSSGNLQEYSPYIQQVIANHPDPTVKRVVQADFGPDRKIIEGKPVPAFSFVSLDNPAAKFTNESLKGTTYIIDFWATWCGPCVEEMENMHREYEKYHARGFEILSLSLDDKPEIVNQFRLGKWKMPWLNSFLVGGIDSQVAREFEILGLPRPILVDKTGRIVAIGLELRGPNLDKTLARALAKSVRAPSPM